MGFEKRRYKMPEFVISTEAKVKMLSKLLIAWDGQWFLKTAQEFGLENAIRLNNKVRHSFGRIEMRRLLDAIGKPKVTDLKDIAFLICQYFSILAEDAIASFRQAEGEIEITVTQCPAYEGSKKANLERTDQGCESCYGLWQVWVDELTKSPVYKAEVKQQMGKGAPYCLVYIKPRVGG